MRLKSNTCQHLENLVVKPSNKYVCEACVKTGSHWVHLRNCQTCGVTLCCDSSPNQHASKHYQQTGHPVVISAEPGESWGWCYHDQVFKTYSL